MNIERIKMEKMAIFSVIPGAGITSKQSVNDKSVTHLPSDHPTSLVTVKSLQIVNKPQEVHIDSNSLYPIRYVTFFCKFCVNYLLVNVLVPIILTNNVTLSLHRYLAFSRHAKASIERKHPPCSVLAKLFQSF